MTPQDVRAVIAVAAFRVVWGRGPDVEWLADRMGWTGEASAELNRLGHLHLVLPDGSELYAPGDAVTGALEAWRTSSKKRAA